MIACFELFFRFGVRHIFNTLIRPNQFAEVGRYRERLLDWLDWGVAGPEALADYARLGWRVRLLGTMSVPAVAGDCRTPARGYTGNIDSNCVVSCRF